MYPTQGESSTVLYADDMLLLKPFRNYNDYKYFQDDVNAVHNHNIATRLLNCSCDRTDL